MKTLQEYFNETTLTGNVRHALDDYVVPALDAELLAADCPPESWCGKAITAICHDTAQLIATMGVYDMTDEGVLSDILKAVNRQCCLLYFG